MIERMGRQGLPVLATLLLHVVFVQAVVLGRTGTKNREDSEQGPGASAILSSSGAYLSVVFVHLAGDTESELSEDVSSRGKEAANELIQVASADPTPLAPPFMPELEVSEEGAEAMSMDQATRSALFGTYTGQIDARIRRAWQRPRAPVAATLAGARERFRCQAKIVQDATGTVTEVELGKCNGSSAWQLSLVAAIQRSSPLPAPPDPAVFSRVLMLSFDAAPYESGAREADYESATPPQASMLPSLPGSPSGS